MNEVYVGIDDNQCWVGGRNGLAKCSGLSLWESSTREGYTYLDMYNSKHLIHSGSGMMIPSEAMDKLALKWLQMRGIIHE